MIRSKRALKDRSHRRVAMRVVVVMPARNEERLISKSIESIPELVDWVIVVDDGSTDKTRDISQKTLGVVDKSSRPRVWESGAQSRLVVSKHLLDSGKTVL